MASPPSRREPKRRASRACDHCRVRKVRCDIVHQVDRCTNCYLDKIECVAVAPRRRKRGTGRRIKDDPPPVVPPPPPQQQALAYTTPSERASGSSLDPDPLLRVHSAVSGCEAEPSTTSTTDEDQPWDTMQGPDEHPLPDSNEDLFPDFTDDLLKNGGSGRTCNHPAQVTRETYAEKAMSKSWQRLLPPFIAPIQSQRTYLYRDFLSGRGAFDLPSPKLRNAILMRFADYVYPQLPLLDLNHVLQAVATDGQDCKVSLLLFSTMMLAGSAYVDAEYVLEAGYSGRMSLRYELAEKVRLLYDFDCEPDRLILVQSLILMTSWQDKGDEVKHLRHWISIAYNIASLLGLNKDPLSLSIPARQKHLRKRIWWSLYLRDRTLTLGLRQPSIIPESRSDLPDLTPEDFDIQPASPQACALLEKCSLLRDTDLQLRLSEIFIAQLQLSHHLADVLRSRYTAVAPKLGSTRMIALVLVPKPSNTNTSDIQSCSERLNQWLRDLPEYLRHPTLLPLYSDLGKDTLIVHAGILNLFYFALVCALHRPYHSRISGSTTTSDFCSQRRARHAANAICSILEEFQAQDLIGYLSTLGITCMLQAAVTHLCDSTSNNVNLRNQSQRHLGSCLDILNTLRDHHMYAPYAINLLTPAVSKLFQNSCAAGRPGVCGPAPDINYTSLTFPPSVTEVASHGAAAGAAASSNQSAYPSSATTGIVSLDISAPLVSSYVGQSGTALLDNEIEGALHGATMEYSQDAEDYIALNSLNFLDWEVYMNPNHGISQ